MSKKESKVKMFVNYSDPLTRSVGACRSRQVFVALFHSQFLSLVLKNFYNSSNPRLQGLRKWGIKGFEKYLIFYLVTEELLSSRAK